LSFEDEEIQKDINIMPTKSSVRGCESSLSAKKSIHHKKSRHDFAKIKAEGK
jgi:hypothetical protein